ncbi:hypothetical protein C8R42DRAFT_179027, partial [Lentinula raphanica]
HLLSSPNLLLHVLILPIPQLRELHRHLLDILPLHQILQCPLHIIHTISPDLPRQLSSPAYLTVIHQIFKNLVHFLVILEGRLTVQIRELSLRFLIRVVGKCERSERLAVLVIGVWGFGGKTMGGVNNEGPVLGVGAFGVDPKLDGDSFWGRGGGSSEDRRRRRKRWGWGWRVYGVVGENAQRNSGYIIYMTSRARIIGCAPKPDIGASFPVFESYGQRVHCKGEDQGGPNPDQGEYIHCGGITGGWFCVCNLEVAG